MKFRAWWIVGTVGLVLIAGGFVQSAVEALAFTPSLARGGYDLSVGDTWSVVCGTSPTMMVPQVGDRLAAEGCAFALVGVRVKNTTDNPRTFSASWFLFDDAGQTYHPTTSLGNDLSTEGVFNTFWLSEGAEQSGFLVFEVPSGAKDLIIGCSVGGFKDQMMWDLRWSGG